MTAFKSSERYSVVVVGSHPVYSLILPYFLRQGKRVLWIPLSDDRKPSFALKEELGQGDELSSGFLKNLKSLNLTEDERVALNSRVFTGFIPKATEINLRTPQSFLNLFNPVARPLEYEQLQRQKWIQQGVDIADEDSLVRVFVENGVFCGIQLQDDSSMIAAEQIFFVQSTEHILNEYLQQEVAPSFTHMKMEFSAQFSKSIHSSGMPELLYCVFDEDEDVRIERVRDALNSWVVSALIPLNDRSFERSEQFRFCYRLFSLLESLTQGARFSLKNSMPRLDDPETAKDLDLPQKYPARFSKQVHYSLRYGYSTPPGELSRFGAGLFFWGPDQFPSAGDLSAFYALSRDRLKLFPVPTQGRVPDSEMIFIEKVLAELNAVR